MVRRRSAGPTWPATSRPMIALANTVRQGNRLSLWNTKPRSPPGRCTGLPSSSDLARAGRFETRDDAQESGLAAPGGAHDRDELTALDGKIDVLQRVQLAERFAEIGGRELRHRA